MEKKNIASRTRKAAALAASALMAAALLPSLASPEMAFAADETRTYTWANGTQQPSIPQTITGADGKTYHLTNQSQPVQANGTQTITQYFTQTVNSQIWPDQLGNLANIVARSFHVDADGFVGDIPRTGINYTPIYRNEPNKITDTTSAVASTQEAARAALPATINRDGRTLTLGDVTFEPANTDSAGIVHLWRAIGTYSVDIPGQVLDHYNVAAHYAGNLTKVVNNGDWSIQATYTNNDEEEQQPEEEQPAEEEQSEDAPDEEIIEMPAEIMDEEGNISPVNTNTASKNANDNEDDADETAEDEMSIPIIPIAIAGGVVVAGLVITGIAVMSRRRKKAAAGADVAAAAPMIVTIEDPQCQLIQVTTTEVVDEAGEVDLEVDQQTLAELEIIPSCAADIPTIVYFPSLIDEDGERIEFRAAEGAQYWVAIDEDTVNAVPSKEIIIATDEDNEIFRGELIDPDGDVTNQMLLNADQMVAAMNADEDAELSNIADELAAYDARTAEYVEAAAAAESAQAMVADDGIEGYPDGAYELDSLDEFEYSEDLGDGSFLDIDEIEEVGEFGELDEIEGIEEIDEVDEIDEDMFADVDGASDDDVDAFDIDDVDDVDGFELEIESADDESFDDIDEMPDDGILEPDVDGFDFSSEEDMILIPFDDAEEADADLADSEADDIDDVDELGDLDDIFAGVGSEGDEQGAEEPLAEVTGSVEIDEFAEAEEAVLIPIEDDDDLGNMFADADALEEDESEEAMLVPVEDDDDDELGDMFADADVESEPKREMDPDNEYDRFQAMLDDID